jgi:hypothetical protein
MKLFILSALSFGIVLAGHAQQKEKTGSSRKFPPPIVRAEYQNNTNDTVKAKFAPPVLKNDNPTSKKSKSPATQKFAPPIIKKEPDQTKAPQKNKPKKYPPPIVTDEFKISN